MTRTWYRGGGVYTHRNSPNTNNSNIFHKPLSHVTSISYITIHHLKNTSFTNYRNKNSCSPITRIDLFTVHVLKKNSQFTFHQEWNRSFTNHQNGTYPPLYSLVTKIILWLASLWFDIDTNVNRLILLRRSRWSRNIVKSLHKLTTSFRVRACALAWFYIDLIHKTTGIFFVLFNYLLEIKVDINY